MDGRMIKDILEMLYEQERELTGLMLRASELSQRSVKLRTLIEQRLAQAEKDLLVLNGAMARSDG
jgi:hypothetical protein